MVTPSLNQPIRGSTYGLALPKVRRRHFSLRIELILPILPVDGNFQVIVHHHPFFSNE
jgi:hypothetical protein